MATEDTALDTDPLPAAKVDEAFELLADPCRRTVLAELEPQSTVAVEDLAERIAERSESLSPKRAEVALVHTHLPRLEESDVITVDRTGRTLEMNDDPGIRSILSAITERS